MPTKIGCVNATLLFLFLSFGAQLIGFCIPGWLHIIILTPNPLDHPEKSISKNFALWYVVICWKEVCLTKSYSQLKQDRIDSSENKYAFHDDWNELNDYDYSAKYSKFPFSRLLEFQIEAVSALVVAFMGLVHMRIQKKRLVQYMSGKREEEPKQSTYCMVFCYSIISGGLVLVPASKFLEVNKDLKTVADNYIVGIPYALICSGNLVVY
ncbi:uncharacterized protein LOC132743868 [Ruditapes philippinarum]|uniref:uncharacterized protein LOC132743868 n=1 Tax=Ruditapes philippinarum TaxID=129788 RepID=UPI00295AECE6|nr:uncharacterized protein LOC132743868 [Ruditapes philippinarum]